MLITEPLNLLFYCLETYIFQFPGCLLWCVTEEIMEQRQEPWGHVCQSSHYTDRISGALCSGQYTGALSSGQYCEALGSGQYCETALWSVQLSSALWSVL